MELRALEEKTQLLEGTMTEILENLEVLKRRKALVFSMLFACGRLLGLERSHVPGGAEQTTQCAGCVDLWDVLTGAT